MSVDVEHEKRLAAEAAAALVRDGTRVGLGTGSTVQYVLEALARDRRAATVRRIGPVELRDTPRSPDGGVIADYVDVIEDPRELAQRLSATPGVVEHGLFGPQTVTEILIGVGPEVHRTRTGAST